MAFPSVAATNTSTQTFSLTHQVALPANISAGDKLLICLTGFTFGAVSFNTPSGWTALYSVSGGSLTGAAFWKTADGSEGSTVNVTSTASAISIHNSYRITGSSGTPEAATATGNDASPDPPNLSPSWGAADTLWLATAHCANSSADLTAPSNYTNIIEANDSSISTGSARRALNASSENPGTFAGASNGEWVAGTIAFQGSAGFEDAAGSSAGSATVTGGIQAVKNFAGSAAGAATVAAGGDILSEADGAAAGLATVTGGGQGGNDGTGASAGVATATGTAEADKEAAGEAAGIAAVAAAGAADKEAAGAAHCVATAQGLAIVTLEMAGFAAGLSMALANGEAATKLSRELVADGVDLSLASLVIDPPSGLPEQLTDGGKDIVRSTKLF